MKLRVAVTGPKYCASPAWVAVIVQVPPAKRAAVLPDAVQTDAVVEAKLTASPEEAVAVRLTDPVASGVVGIEAKVIV